MSEGWEEFCVMEKRLRERGRHTCRLDTCLWGSPLPGGGFTSYPQCCWRIILACEFVDVLNDVLSDCAVEEEGRDGCERSRGCFGATVEDTSSHPHRLSKPRLFGCSSLSS